MLAAALLFGSAAVRADAQGAVATPPPHHKKRAPAPLPTEAPTPAPLQIFGRYVGEFAANTSGGFQRGTAYASEFQFGADYTTSRAANGDEGTLHLILTERWGSSLSNNAIGNVASVQEIYGDALTPRLTELDYEQTFDGGKLDVHAGRVIMQNDFAASSTYWGGNLWCRYQTNAICGTPVAAPNNSGYGYYPSSEWGAYAKLAPSEGFYVETGAFQVNPLYANRGEGFNLGLYGTTGVDFPLEFGFLEHDRSGMYRGSVRAGGYFDTSVVPGSPNQLGRFVSADNPALAHLPAATYRGRSGGWLLFDRLVAGSSDSNARGTAVFAAYEYGDADTALIANYFEAGLVQHGTFPGRTNDTVALGYYYLDLNPALRSFEQQMQNLHYPVPTTGQEKELELNYGIAVTPQILFRPSLQYVMNPAGEIGGNVYPGGAVGLHDALVFGFNATYSY